MDAYKSLLEQITAKTFENIEIALIALAFWLCGDASMTTTNLTDILDKVGYTFNTDTKILSDGSNNYTLYQALTLAVSSEYHASIMLNSSLLKLIINQAYIKTYITQTEKSTLINLL